jgi:hypothetical protein
MARGDSETVKDLRDSWPSLSMESARAIAMSSQFDAIGLGDGSRAIGLMATRATTTSERVDAALAAHSLALNTGRPADALVQANRLRDLRPDSHAFLRLRMLDALYGGGDSLAGHDAARALDAPLDSVFRDFPLVRSRGAADACVLGQWRLAHADTTDVQSMLQLLRASQRRDDQLVSAAPWVCADLIEAQLAVATGRRDALARVDRLDALVLTSAVAGNASLYANIALARMYSALGHPHRALATLRRRTYMAGWPAYLATAWREEAALARAIGDGARAERSSGHLSSLTAAGRSAAQLPH